MSMIKRFATVHHMASAEITEKKSRFIATVMPVCSEDEARRFIEETKKKYYDARHNVFAYQAGDQNEIQRMSDDGEPNGTAGLPVLDVLRKGDIRNTCIVVTRYFGGILLGTGGLVRAYGRAASAGVDAAGIVTKILYTHINITSGYKLSGRIQYETLQNGHIIQDTVYTDLVSFDVLAELDKAEEFIKLITDATNAEAVIRENESVFGYFFNGKLILD